MAKFLITGGAGFIGGNFCHYMVNTYPNDLFVCIDALTYAGNIETLAPIIDKPNFKFVHENICNKEAVESLFEKEKFDYVINFAAESHVDRSIENPGIFLQTNIIGTETLMDACRKYGIKRYHQVSTDEVYGDLPLDRLDLFFTEDTANKNRKPEYLYEEDGLYFNKKYKTNSRGVIKFPTNIDVKNVKGGVLSPKPLYINFDLSLIGYKYAQKSGDKWNEGDVTPWKDVLKQHNIKGFFFVRQKRIPTILGQGMVIGLTHQLCGALPVIKDDSGKFIVQPFIG